MHQHQHDHHHAETLSVFQLLAMPSTAHSSASRHRLATRRTRTLSASLSPHAHFFNPFQLLAAEEKGDKDSEALSDSDEEKERKRKQQLREEWSDDDSEEEERRKLPLPYRDVPAASAAIVRLWLLKARENMRFPTVASWLDHVNETLPRRDIPRPSGFRQRSQWIAASTVLDRL